MHNAQCNLQRSKNNYILIWIVSLANMKFKGLQYNDTYMVTLHTFPIVFTAYFSIRFDNLNLQMVRKGVNRIQEHLQCLIQPNVHIGSPCYSKGVDYAAEVLSERSSDTPFFFQKKLFIEMIPSSPLQGRLRDPSQGIAFECI